MDLKTVDLYQYWSFEKPVGADGSLDCYLQPTTAAFCPGRRRPAVLIVPGGGYDHVSVREAEPVALRYLARGYHAFVLRYSVAPLRFPAPLREAAMATAYIRKNAADLQVNPDMVAAVGFSAGGHLCGMLGTMFDCPEVADIESAQLLRPDALGLCYPVAVSWGKTHEGSFRNLCGDDLLLRRRLSLDSLVRPDMPPVFLWHTRDDASVPCRNSLILAQKLEEAGVDLSLHLYRSGCHGLSTADAQVYSAHRVPAISRDVPGWVESQMGFFEEIGFRITDKEV